MASLVSVQTQDGTLEVPFNVIQMSVTVKQMMEDLEITEENANQVPIPINKVDHEIMVKIIEWCTYHKDGNSNTDGPLCPRFVEDDIIEDWVEDKKVQEWDNKFFSAMDPAFLLQVLKDANYLHVKGLVELVSCQIATMMNGKDKVELETEFGVIEDQTPEAIKAIDDEVAWLINQETPNHA